MATIISSKTSGVGGLSVTGDASGVLQLASADGTPALTINASQNVGIGTTASLSRLTALGTTSTVSNGASTRNPIASIRGGNDNNRLDFYVDNSGATAIMGLGAYNTAGAGTAMGFYTGASASESMRIDSSGNVGIGTSNPYSQLDVYSGIANPTSGEASGVGTIRITNGASVLTSAGGLEFKVAGDSNGYGSKIQALNSGGSQLVFANRNASATWIERLRIDSSGNVTLQKNISVGAAAPTTSGTGITFPATQSASSNANTLDDYEEGTWTPVPSAGITFAGTASYNANYTKIGRLVTANISISGQPTVHQWDSITLPFPIFGSTAGIANCLGGDIGNGSVAWASWSSNLLVFGTTKTIDVNGLHMCVIYNTTT